MRILVLTTRLTWDVSNGPGRRVPLERSQIEKVE